MLSDCTKTGKITGNTAFGLGSSISASYPMLLAGSTQDYSAYFTPDDPDAFVLFSGSALTLCAKPSATLEGDTLTVSTSSNYKPDAFVLFVAEYDADGRLLAVHSENITPESGIYTFKVQLGAKSNASCCAPTPTLRCSGHSHPTHNTIKTRRMGVPSAGLLCAPYTPLAP